MLVETLVQIGDRVRSARPSRGSTCRARRHLRPDRMRLRPLHVRLRRPSVAAMQPVPPGAEATEPERLRATPLARRLARQRGIDLASLRGTGRRGRIERRDVEAAAAGEPGIGGQAGLALREDGPATGPATLFLHGFAGDRTVWAGLSAIVAEAGYRMVAVDLPAHGATTFEAATAADLAAPLPTSRGTRRGKGLSTSSLTPWAQSPPVTLAETVPVASLTLIAPAGLGHAIDAGFIRGMARARGPGEVAHLLGRMTDGPNGLSEAAIATIAETRREDASRGSRTASSVKAGSGEHPRRPRAAGGAHARPT